MLVEFFSYFLSRYFSYALGLTYFSSRAFWILVGMSVLVMGVIGRVSMDGGFCFDFLSAHCIIY